MSIELELRLEGDDANEDTLLDLIDWLERANIDGLKIKRKELPPAKDDMGVVPDVDTIVTCLQTYHDFQPLIEYIQTWYSFNRVMICPKLNNISDKLQDEIPNH
jgi:hypothetical protein